MCVCVCTLCVSKQSALSEKPLPSNWRDGRYAALQRSRSPTTKWLGKRDRLFVFDGGFCYTRRRLPTRLRFGFLFQVTQNKNEATF